MCRKSTVNSKVNVCTCVLLFPMLLVNSQIQLHTCLPNKHSCIDLPADPTICRMQQPVEEIPCILKKKYLVCQILSATQKRHPFFGLHDWQHWMQFGKKKRQIFICPKWTGQPVSVFMRFIKILMQTRLFYSCTKTYRLEESAPLIPIHNESP